MTKYHASVASAKQTNRHSCRVLLEVAKRSQCLFRAMAKTTHPSITTARRFNKRRIANTKVAAELLKYKALLPSTLYAEARQFLRTHKSVTEEQLRSFISKQVETQQLNVFIKVLVLQKIETIIRTLYPIRSNDA